MSTRDTLGELLRAAGRRDAPPPEAYEHVLATATQVWQSKVRSRRRRQWLIAASVSFLALAGVVVGVLRWAPVSPIVPIASTVVLRGNAAILLPRQDVWQPLQLGAQIQPGTRIRTGGHGGVALDLVGGRSLRVDRQSELLLSAPDAARLFIGAVYVDTGTEHLPLRIETDSGSVRDMGTIFEVRAAPDTLRIRVREGRVRMDSRLHTLSVETTAGEEVMVDKRGSVRRSELPISSDTWAWAEALVLAPPSDGWPLMQFLSWVARETGRQLQFEEPALEAQAHDIILHGATRDLAPLEALDLMLSTTEFEYSLPADDVIFIRRRQD
jgi:hypothetical protein